VGREFDDSCEGEEGNWLLPRQHEDKAQGSAHGRRLHVLHGEAGRQVAHVRAAAGAVGTQRWRSASVCGRNDAQARARSGKRPSGLGQSKPAWPRAGFKMDLGRTE
jgi:hypothetical protein